MDIIKFSQFIKENQDTEESYSNSLLSVLKKKIDKMFNFEQTEEADDEMTIKKAKIGSNNKNNPTFKEFGIRLESSEVSKNNNTLTVKFSDDENTYALTISIDLAEVSKDLSDKQDQDFNINDIKKCYLKFKKYDIETFEVIGQIDKNVEVKNIDEEYLINLKIEIDDLFGDEEENFEIETE